MRDEDGYSKQFGFICFEKPEKADECIQQSTLIMIHGQQPYISHAMSHEMRLKANKQKQQQQQELAKVQSFAFQMMMPAFNPFNQPPNIPPNFVFNPIQNVTNNQSPFNQVAQPFPFPFSMFNLDPKSLQQEEIMEKCPKNQVLFLKLRDMSDQQARELAENHGDKETLLFRNMLFVDKYDSRFLVCFRLEFVDDDCEIFPTIYDFTKKKKMNPAIDSLFTNNWILPENLLNPNNFDSEEEDEEEEEEEEYIEDTDL